MQDEIVARLAGQLNTELITAEARRAERAPTPDSMDLYFQGMAWVNKGRTTEYMTQARALFERALARDPSNIEALVGIALTDIVRATFVLADNPLELLAAAEAALTKALSLSPRHALAHLCLGRAQITAGRTVEGIAECERALVLDRNLADAHAAIGAGKIYIGRAEQTEAHTNEALRLSPHDTNAYVWMSVAGWAKLLLGRDDEAASLLQRAIEINRNNPMGYFWLAAALAHLGRLNEAHAAAQAGLARSPTLTIARYVKLGLERWGENVYLAQRERLRDGMRKAGVPEG
jgi:tetratricopeptide (TPR) repeat protein